MDRNISDLPTYQIGILQSRANRNVQELYERILKEYDLTTPEWFVLGYVDSKTADGGVKVGGIAQELDVQSTYATALLRRLESKALVEARAGNVDRRVRLVSATKKGTTLATAINADIEKIGHQKLSGMSSTVVRHYLSVLEALAR